MYQTVASAGDTDKIPQAVLRGIWDAFSYVVCSADASLGKQILAYRTTSITYICPPAWFGDTATGTCQLCQPGFVQAKNESTQGKAHEGEGRGGGGGGGRGGGGCEPCAPGSNRSVVSGSCLPCPRGSYAGLPGAAVCGACPPGTFASFEGQVACEACPAGTHAEKAASASCTPCGPRHYAPVAGLSKVHIFTFSVLATR
jgi:hypothetical protein